MKARHIRDWHILLTVFAAFLLLGILWSAYVFASVKQGDVVSGLRVSDAPHVDPASVQAVEDIFAQRASEAAKYADGTYTFVDPSK